MLSSWLGVAGGDGGGGSLPVGTLEVEAFLGSRLRGFPSVGENLLLPVEERIDKIL